VRELDTRKIGYLTMLEPNAKEKEKGVKIDDVAGTFRPMTTAPFITNTGYDKAKGNAVIGDGKADLVAFGVPYIANPDLVDRFRANAELNKPNPALFYGVGAEGYTDYPFMTTTVTA
jgi:N-ethylmaleimide reductase